MAIIHVAFVKFGGLSSGGTERWMQIMAANLPKSRFDVDYYYCDTAPYLGSDYKHANTDSDRMEYMKKSNINLIKFHVGLKDMTVPTHDWIDTNFWEKFDENKYDIIQSAKAGPSEYPFNKFKKAHIVDSVHLFGVDNNPNIVWTCFLSEWSRRKWSLMGGDLNRSSVIPAPIERPITKMDLRAELNIPVNSVVAGFHQRPDNNIASDIPLLAFSVLENENYHFVIMGGGDIYRKQAKKLNLKNIHFLEASADTDRISSFLNTLDIFAHGRKDGETFGTVFAEAMIHGLPCLSHETETANAQKETMSQGGFFAVDLVDYSDKLKKLFENINIRSELGNFGKRHALELYTVEGVIKKLIDVYDKVLENKCLVSMGGSQYANIVINKNEFKESYKNKLLINVKKFVYNKYFFICYRFFKKTRQKLFKK